MNKFIFEFNLLKKVSQEQFCLNILYEKCDWAIGRVVGNKSNLKNQIKTFKYLICILNRLYALNKLCKKTN